VLAIEQLQAQHIAIVLGQTLDPAIRSLLGRRFLTRLGVILMSGGGACLFVGFAIALLRLRRRRLILSGSLIRLG